MAIDSKNLLVWVKAMSRGQALPLDASEIYETFEEAENYASTSAIAYAGQIIKVKLSDGKYHVYTLQPAASGYTLEEISGNGNIGTGGTGGPASPAIIDVLELPTENINENVFYRLMTAKWASNYYSAIDDWVCYCVNELPSVGEPVSTDMVNITAYYNMQDGETYAYADSMISAAGGIPVGWYPIAMLAQAFDISYGGVITDPDKVDDSAKALLSKDFYIYQDGWCKVPIAYEKAPEFDIQWDGDMTDHVALDMSMLGYDPGTYFVKVSDEVFTTEDLIGWNMTQLWHNGDRYTEEIEESMFDTETYPGAFTIGNYIVVMHSQDDLANALGIPTGIYTNGVYFLLNNNLCVTNLTSPTRITKIDAKYLDVNVDFDVSYLGLHSVATSGDYNDLWNRPNLSNYATTSQLSNYATTSQLSNYATTSQLSNYTKRTDVETMISNAIGSAIGGSY